MTRVVRTATQMVCVTQKPAPGNRERVLYQWISVGKGLALQSLFHGHSHGNSSTDHGVVAHAQEAHHFHVKSTLRRLCGDFSRAFGAVSPSFRKTRGTSIVSIECAFLTGTHLITSSVHETSPFDLIEHPSSSFYISPHLPSRSKKRKISFCFLP